MAIRQSNLAVVYQDLGDYEKARELWNSAYTIFMKKLGPEHPHTKTVQQFLDSIK
ncbi:MAG: tetratricopeptide repeat protein [Saprospiraceae bacterium]|nr:tetratricopeptide repeat protein [Saprospiraceae bacterium]